MNWEQARKLLRRRSRSAAGSALHGSGSTETSTTLHGVRARSVCVVSGKGGTGKSVVSASLATLLARRGRTLVVDADMGVGNAHILQDVSPEHSFVDVVEGRKGVAEVVVSCGAQLDLLAAGSGVSHMATLSSYELHMVAAGIECLERDYAFVLVDSAAGISDQTVAFAAASDVVVVVTTPDLTAMTDAYAFLKVLLQREPSAAPLFVVNRARSHAEAEHVAERMHNVTHKFLSRVPRWVGTIPEDACVSESVNRRSPVIRDAPQSPAAQALRALSVAVFDELDSVHPRGLGRSMVRSGGCSSRVV